MRASVEERLLAGVESDEERTRLEVLLAHQKAVEQARFYEDHLQAFAHFYDGMTSDRRRMRRSLKSLSGITVLLYVLAGLLGLGVFLLYKQVIVSP